MSEYTVHEIYTERGSAPLEVGEWQSVQVTQARLNADGTLDLAVQVKYVPDSQQVHRLMLAYRPKYEGAIDTAQNVLRSMLTERGPVRGEEQWYDWLTENNARA